MTGNVRAGWQERLQDLSFKRDELADRSELLFSCALPPWLLADLGLAALRAERVSPTATGAARHVPCRLWGLLVVTMSSRLEQNAMGDPERCEHQGC